MSVVNNQATLMNDGGGGYAYDSIDVVVDNKTKLLQRIKGEDGYSAATESEAKRYYNDYKSVRSNHPIKKSEFNSLADKLVSPNASNYISDHLSSVVDTLYGTNSFKYYYAATPQQFFRDMNDFINDIDTMSKKLKDRQSSYNGKIDRYNNDKIDAIIQAAKDRLEKIKGENNNNNTGNTHSPNSYQQPTYSGGGGGGGGRVMEKY